MYDFDFLIYYIENLLKTITYYYDSNNLIFRCSLYESNNFIDNNRMVRKELSPYSYVWIYNVNIAKELNCFNESIIGWEFEEMDIATRMLKNGNNLIHINNNYFLHLTHSDVYCNKSNAKKYKNILIPRNIDGLNSYYTNNKTVFVFNYYENLKLFLDE